MGEGEFNYSFVEDEVEKLYDDDKRTTHIYVTFAGLAICVSCLGLFGLSLYDIRQRYREIALRKVNGATGQTDRFVIGQEVSLYFWEPPLLSLFLWSIILLMTIPKTLR